MGHPYQHHPGQPPRDAQLAVVSARPQSCSVPLSGNRRHTTSVVLAIGRRLATSLDVSAGETTVGSFAGGGRSLWPMRESLVVGVRNSIEVVVEADMSPPHLEPVVVLSTPKMIELMEIASLDGIQPHLDENETSVGTHVNVSHEAAAQGGETVTITSEVESVERRRVTFAVRASVGKRVIGRGTHQRAVVDTTRFG